jgi:Tol biopolymer transport system component
MKRKALVPTAVLTAALALPASGGATFPGANGRILIQRGLPGTLYTIAPQGGPLTRLVTGRLLSDGMFSPDGTQVAFSRATSNTSPVEIAIANVDGTGLRVLTHQRGFSIGAAWSPDGSKLVYGTDEGAPPPKSRNALPPRLRLHVINADGTGDARLITANRDAIDPVFSPDGTKIAYMVAQPVGGRFADNRIFVANADGTGAHPITSHGTINEQNASWSPDGTRIAVELAPRRPGQPRSDIAIMNADGTGLRRIAATRWWETNPIWSPDGTRLAFTSDRGTRPKRSDRLGPGFELYTVGVDGSGLQRLTNNKLPDVFPEWQTLKG